MIYSKRELNAVVRRVDGNQLIQHGLHTHAMFDLFCEVIRNGQDSCRMLRCPRNGDVFVCVKK